MKIRPMRDEDWNAFVRFGRKYFGMSHNQNPGFNKHWFKRTVGDEKIDDWLDGWTGIVVDGPDGDLAGVMMLIVMKGYLEGQSLPMTWISTGVVSEEGRRVGIGAQMYLWIYRNFPLVGALSGNENSLPINSALGQDIPGVAMSRYLRIHSQGALELSQPAMREAVSALFARQPAAGAGPFQGEWRDTLGGVDIAGLWVDFRESVSCTTERSAEHLSWRFENAPYVDYRFLEIHDHNRAQGLAVVRFQPTPAGLVCRVVDFMGRPDAFAECWQAIGDACGRAGALYSDFLVVGTHLRAAICAGGYWAENEEPDINFLPNLLSPVDHRIWTNTFHLGGAAARKDQRWRRADGVYFTKADSDRDWPTQFDLDRLNIVD